MLDQPIDERAGAQGPADPVEPPGEFGVQRQQVTETRRYGASTNGCRSVFLAARRTPGQAELGQVPHWRGHREADSRQPTADSRQPTAVSMAPNFSQRFASHASRPSGASSQSHSSSGHENVSAPSRLPPTTSQCRRRSPAGVRPGNPCSRAGSRCRSASSVGALTGRTWSQPEAQPVTARRHVPARTGRSRVLRRRTPTCVPCPPRPAARCPTVPGGVGRSASGARHLPCSFQSRPTSARRILTQCTRTAFRGRGAAHSRFRTAAMSTRTEGSPAAAAPRSERPAASAPPPRTRLAESANVLVSSTVSCT